MVKDDDNQKSQRIRRIDGRLHTIEEVRDEAGKLITQIASPLKVELCWGDIAQLIVGAFMLGVPVALTEEVWDLGASLPTYRIIGIAIMSVLVNAFFVKVLFYGDRWREFLGEFCKRVLASYGITLIVSLLLLEIIDMGLLADPALAIRRAVIIALPASFAATAVDYIR